MRFASRCHDRRLLARTYKIADVKVKSLDKKAKVHIDIKDRHLEWRMQGQIYV